MFLLAQAHRNGKNPSEDFGAAVVRQQIRLRLLDRLPLKCVASARCVSEQSDKNYI